MTTDEKPAEAKPAEKPAEAKAKKTTAKRKAPARRKATAKRRSPAKGRKPVTPSTNAEGLSRAVGADVPALRKQRAQVLDDIRKADTEQTEAVVAEADKAGLHDAKLDDVGAAAQQKAARDNAATASLTGDLEGPPVVAPVIEDSPGKIKIVSRREGAKFEKGLDYVETKSERFVGFNLHIIGEDFPYPGEVVIDIRRDNEQDHQRFSTWTEDGNIDVVLPGINGVGDWLVHCESLVTQVGEGRDDRLPLIKATDPIKLELY